MATMAIATVVMATVVRNSYGNRGGNSYGNHGISVLRNATMARMATVVRNSYGSHGEE